MKQQPDASKQHIHKAGLGFMIFSCFNLFLAAFFLRSSTFHFPLCQTID
jgi:hypothetical protein